MQLRVEDASFLKCLEESRGWSVLSTKSKEEALNAPALKEVEEELLDKKQQSEDDDDENSSRANGEEAEGLSEGWELVEKEEVLDAMAMFIAAYIQVSGRAEEEKILTTFACKLTDVYPASPSPYSSFCSVSVGPSSSVKAHASGDSESFERGIQGAKEE